MDTKLELGVRVDDDGVKVGLEVEVGMKVEVEVGGGVLEVEVEVEVEVDDGVGVVEVVVGRMEVLLVVDVVLTIVLVLELLVEVVLTTELVLMLVVLSMELVEAGTDAEDEDEDSSLPPLLLPPLSKTTICAFSPFGTVTTQNEAPPAPSSVLPIISLTLFTSGSILQGSPLHPSPSHSISTPNSGTSLRNGVVGSR